MSILPTVEEEIEATVRQYLETWAEPGVSAVDHTVGYIAEDFSGLGTGQGDYYPDRAAMVELFRREKSQMPDAPVTFDLSWVHVRLLRPDLALVDCQIRSEVIVQGETHRVDPRGSYVLEKQGERWLITHIHFSMADARQHEGDTLVETLKRRTSKLEEEVAQRTAELEQSLADLKATQAQLVQSEKMASLGQLTAGIAHEIKNPLNFVTNFAGLSQEIVDDLELESDPEERAALLADLKTNAAKIEEHGRRADAIVRTMMEHARSGTGQRQTVDLNGLVEEYAAHALHAMKVRHSGFEPVLSLDLADDAGALDVAPQEIGRVLINLVDNALSAVRQREADAGAGYTPTVTVSTGRTADGVEMRVTDNGLGMSEDVKANVFQPFFTTKPAGEGTGLGLSLSHDIVVQGHSGTITMESQEGAGTTAVVRLPVAG